MTIYLNSYRPLVSTKTGRNVSHTYGILPFVDGSCRREPDFESPYPSISALCRGSKFAPKLCKGDIIVYITVKRKYCGVSSKAHWRLVSILKVIERFESHKDAANWYKSKKLKLPSNCIVKGNKPYPMYKTLGKHCSLKGWDGEYKKRANENGDFLVCNSLYKELCNPPLIDEEKMNDIFGKIRNTQNPPKVSKEQFKRLKRILL